MKLKSALLIVSVGAVSLVSAQQYAAQVTVQSGNSFVVKHLNIEGKRLYSDDRKVSTSTDMIKDLEFRFTGFDLGICQRMFFAGDYAALEELMDRYVMPVTQYVNIPGNLGKYLIWMLRTQYWTENRAGMLRTIQLLEQTNTPDYMDAANLYLCLQMLDSGKADEAKVLFEKVETPDRLSAAMAGYLRGRFALAAGDYREAMRHVAEVIAFHGRDPEWMAPTTALEAQIYQFAGQPAKAALVAEELVLAYPGSRWSDLGKQIQQETTGNRGE